MKKIHYNNLPVKFPLITVPVVYTCLHYWNVPMWAYGVFWTVTVLVLISSLVELTKQEYLDLNK